MLKLIKLLLSAFSRPNRANMPDILESRIDGQFAGWSGETIFKLRNGQVWQQSSDGLLDHHSYRPVVLIYRSGTGHKMKVDGVNQTISVKRLKWRGASPF
ncbi:MAG TPA: hypothetical protein VE398_24355 [Acidobacteriota bacterium]|nr:hypothetical protein [Acidobacteriota bacterium]